MLTDSALTALLQTVETVAPFRRVDFDTKQEERRVVINYRRDLQCRFAIAGNNPGTTVTIWATPDSSIEGPEAVCSDFESLKCEFHRWLERILEAHSISASQPSGLRPAGGDSETDRRNEAAGSREDELASFTREEVTEIVKRLGQLEQEMADHIFNNAEQVEHVVERLRILEIETAFLKEALHTINCASWFLTCGSRR